MAVCKKALYPKELHLEEETLEANRDNASPVSVRKIFGENRPEASTETFCKLKKIEPMSTGAILKRISKSMIREKMNHLYALYEAV